MAPRVVFLVFLALMTAIQPSLACINDDTEQLGEFQPSIVDGRVVGNPIGSMHVDGRAVLRLGLVGKGDHWELPPGGGTDLVDWETRVLDGDPGVLNVSLWGKKPGLAMIPLRYVRASGAPAGTSLLSLRVSPPPPPPPPPTLTVTKAEFSGGVLAGWTFLIHLAVPLAPDHHWEIREAVTSDGEPVELAPQAGEAGLFKGVPRGRQIRIVFVAKSDGWQLFPETVTLNLIVSPIPKC